MLYLGISSGICWMITYILIIAVSYRDKSYGMPMMALCANIAWEFIFAFVTPHGPIQRTINITWFFLDLVILCQFLRYSPRDFPFLSTRLLRCGLVLGIVCAGGIIYLMTPEFKDTDGAYAAFGQNLMMSVLFISMLLQRNSTRGQSVWIAFFKMLGTALMSGYFTIVPVGDGHFFHFLFAAILLFDLIYLVLLVTWPNTTGGSVKIG